MNPQEGGSFEVWDGYITGINREIFPYKKIVQTWRTTEFSDIDKDSQLELLFTEKDGCTLLSLNHTNIPDGEGEKYKKGWKDFYFVNMKKMYEK